MSKTDLEWQDRGTRKVEKADPAIFFVQLGVGHSAAEAERAFAPAKAYCSRCPVAAACLEYALGNHPEGQDFGYWGNTTPAERRRIKRRRRKLAATAAQAASQGLVGATGS